VRVKAIAAGKLSSLRLILCTPALAGFRKDARTPQRGVLRSAPILARPDAYSASGHHARSNRRGFSQNLPGPAKSYINCQNAHKRLNFQFAHNLPSVAIVIGGRPERSEGTARSNLLRLFRRPDTRGAGTPRNDNMMTRFESEEN
jgi:hypothetical protein